MNTQNWTIRVAQCAVIGALGASLGAAQAANHVDSQNREWLDMSLVTGASWNAIDVVCQSDTEAAGPCAGQLFGSGYDLTGWTWANRAEVVGLIQQFMVASGDNTDQASILSQHGYGTNSFDWGSSLIAAMGQTASVQGDQRTLGFMNGLDVLGFNTTGQLAFICSGATGCGFTSYVGAGVSTGVAPGNSSAAYAGWFYREASPVPEPASYGLLIAGLGVVSLVMRQRRSAKSQA